MTDPLDALRAPVTPAAPDPAFAARLRARLERALGLPEGVAVTETALNRAERDTPAPPHDRGPAGAAPPRQGDISYALLWVPDVARAAAFYGAVLGLEYEPGHDSRGRQAPGLAPPQGLWEHPALVALFCSYVVDDIPAAVAQVRAAGGQAEEPVRRQYGLAADCVDTDGMRFALHQPRAAAPVAAGPPASAAAGHDGDLVYVTLEVPDAARTLEFYCSVLGWRSYPGRTPGGWQVEGTTPMIGVSGGHSVPTAVPVWQVTDLAAAVARARAAGGTSTEPHREPYGLMAECTDDQGCRFSLGQFPG
jgi:predicted enzyme related to lactoylglutathione lyase